jgi:hypothetical protein
MRRTRTGKRLALTSRDLAIFRVLDRYRYLRSTYLHGFAGGASQKRFKERLGDLFHEGFLDRPSEQWQFVNARYMPLVYENAEAARHVLRESGHAPENGRSRNGKTHQFAHALMICEILASIELGTRYLPQLRFIPWPEILAKAPEATRTAQHPLRLPIAEGRGGYLIPDAVFGLEYGIDSRKTYRFFALEADRNTMPIARSTPEQSSYRAKLLGYREIVTRQIHRMHLGVPNLLILTVTTNRARQEHMLSSLAKLSSGGSTAFLFKTMGASDNHLTPELLSEGWERAGHPPISIASQG